ncbi:unnamed protein product [Oikopleura dioica]|uniref:N-acetyltransferase domain-containing protein n=1 Tax=Oikopleura dioica TaxID=34765 RepID=E4Y8X3_OIKDI|nr:unnamed protein product [Oikopleura dioica]
MRVREFHKNDQNAAYEIWKNGMLVDLKITWRSWILGQTHVKLLFLILPIIHMVRFDFSESTFYENSSTHLFWLLNTAVPCFFLIWLLIWRSDYRIEGYVKNRPDMLDIQNHHGRRFLVAENKDGEIVGTAVYTTKTKITNFKGDKISENSWEIFSMSVKHTARRQGVGRFLLDEIEKLAKKSKVKCLVLDSTTPNVPGNNLYKKFGFDWELDAYKRRQSFFGARAFFLACNSSVIKFVKEI